MAKRTVKVAVMTYRTADDEVGAIGYRGQEVDVHDKDVARFDELNVNPGGDEPWEAERRQVNMVSPAAGDETSGLDSGLNTAVEVDDEGNPVDDSTAEEDAAAQDDTDSPKGARRRATKRGSSSRSK